MGKQIVLYKSNYGYTKIYAEMIAEELHCELQRASQFSVDQLEPYDTIIYGGGIYASKINGIQQIKQIFSALQAKHMVVWATGSNSGKPFELQQLWRQNFSTTMLERIHPFYLRGGFDYQKLSLAHKIIMTLFKWKLKAQKKRSEDEEGLLKAYSVPENHCDKKNILELIEYVKSL